MCVVPVDVLEHGQHAAGEHGLEEGEGGLQVPEHDLGLRQPIRGEYCVTISQSEESIVWVAISQSEVSIV